MKKLFLLLFCFVLFFCGTAVADSEQETVWAMPYTADMPDVMRTGKYTGQVANGIPHGYGLFVAVNSDGIRWHYLGEWVDGKMTGEGALYWDCGDSQVGTFENNEFRRGHIWYSNGTHIWIDTNPNEHGHASAIVYRNDGSKYYEYCADPATNETHIVTTYTKDGEIYFSGIIGEDFNLNLFLIN